VIMLGLRLKSDLPQINSSRLNSLLSGSGIPFLPGTGRAWGAEWRWVDLEVGAGVTPDPCVGLKRTCGADGRGQ
jgi:hypothetical protein